MFRDHRLGCLSGVGLSARCYGRCCVLPHQLLRGSRPGVKGGETVPLLQAVGYTRTEIPPSRQAARFPAVVYPEGKCVAEDIRQDQVR